MVEDDLKLFFESMSVVMVSGARQVGKTTMIRHVFPDIQRLEFSLHGDNHGAKNDPDLFLKSYKAPLILDEVQYVPELLSAIKMHLEYHNTPSQYILTGSQHIGILKAVSESLAGRVLNLDMLPLALSEMRGRGASGCWLGSYLEEPSSLLALKTYQTDDDLARCIWRGGLPRLLDLSDRMVFNYLSSYVETYLLRDVLSLLNVRDKDRFMLFLGLCAALTAQEVNYSQFGRDVGVNQKTAQSWLSVLKNTFQWHEIPPYHGNTIKRLSEKTKGHFGDTGIACYFQRITSPQALIVSPLFGPLFETWVFNEILRQTASLNAKPNIWHWRTSAGAEVDIILDIDGKFYPIETKSRTWLKKKDASGIKAFRETYGDKLNIMPGLVIYAGTECYWLTESVLAVPWNLDAGKSY